MLIYFIFSSLAKSRSGRSGVPRSVPRDHPRHYRRGRFRATHRKEPAKDLALHA
jgi:hypothetical protein